MDNKLESQLADILSDVSSTVGEAKTFVLAELPDVVQQLLTWYGVYYFITFVVGVMILIGTLYGTYVFIRKYWVESEGLVIFSLIGTILLTLSAAHYINLQWLKIWIAPKIWLIEYAATLTGK